MSIQMSDLTVTDPLADQEVAVVVRVLPDNAQRPARTALVSVGTAGRPPAFASGKLEDVADLIRQAWLAYGVQVEMQQTAAEDAGAGDSETVAEAVVEDESGESGDETPPAAPAQPQPHAQPARPQPRPQPQNLSLFSEVNHGSRPNDHGARSPHFHLRRPSLRRSRRRAHG